MKKLILVSLFLSGCATVGTTSHDCLTRVAAAEVSITESYDTTTKLYLSGTISKDTAKKAVKAIDTANDLADNAVKFCPVDQPKAFQSLADALGIISEINIILGK